jgi:hypothetical protein
MVAASRPPDAGAGTIVVTLPSEIDLANADRVGADLDAAFGPGVGVVVADMSGTRFCDTSGIHALVMAHKRAEASNTRVPGGGRARRGPPRAGNTGPGHGPSHQPAAGCSPGRR